jgi:hypothetical protein
VFAVPCGERGEEGVCVECHMPKTMNALLFPGADAPE